MNTSSWGSPQGFVVERIAVFTQDAPTGLVVFRLGGLTDRRLCGRPGTCCEAKAMPRHRRVARHGRPGGGWTLRSWVQPERAARAPRRRYDGASARRYLTRSDSPRRKPRPVRISRWLARAPKTFFRAGLIPTAYLDEYTSKDTEHKACR